MRVSASLPDRSLSDCPFSVNSSSLGLRRPSLFAVLPAGTLQPVKPFQRGAQFGFLESLIPELLFPVVVHSLQMQLSLMSNFLLMLLQFSFAAALDWTMLVMTRGGSGGLSSVSVVHCSCVLGQQSKSS